MASLQELFSGRQAAPQRKLGVSGTAVFGGYVQSNEKNAKLTGRNRYITFSENLANVDIIGAGVRYFLNLIARAAWSVEPANDTPEAQELADFVQSVIDDTDTPWERIVRRAAMYRFYGFSIQEWTAKRRPDGRIGLLDVEPRPQHTIERWSCDDSGEVLGIIQRSPQTQREIPIPRTKIVYLVDDSLNDSPEGLGLFRHMVRTAARVLRYEDLEAFGYETDLRGIPVGRAPYAMLDEMVKNGEISDSERKQILEPMETFIQRHIRSPELGLLLDSQVYVTTDERGTPSSEKLFDLELLTGSSQGHQEVARAIDRMNHQIARLMGVENLLLGDDGVGSFALSRDKSHNFFLVVDSTLGEISSAFTNDLLRPLWELNGFDEELIPTFRVSDVQFRDTEQLARIVRDLSTAGATFMPGDPVINEVLKLAGLPEQDPMEPEEDDALGPRDPAEQPGSADQNEETDDGPGSRDE